MHMQQHKSISIQHEKMIEQLKFLLKSSQQDRKSDLITLLNKLPPFTRYQLEISIPIQLLQIEQEKIITQDLKHQLSSYSFIILRGSLIIYKDQYQQFTQEKYLDEDNIKEKAVYNFNQGKSKLKAHKNVVYLKIHKIWIKKAQQKAEQHQKLYIAHKLINVDFFSKLTFQEFDNLCKKAFIKKLGPSQVLLSQLQVPYHMYIVAQGQLSLQKRVLFSKQEQVWKQVKAQLKHQNQFSEQLLSYLIREPSVGSPSFPIDFVLSQLHESSILCAKQTLLQCALQYSIISTLTTKLICIKYPDLYLLKEDRLANIRNWPWITQFDKYKLRKQYYQYVNWKDYKQFLRNQHQLTKVEKLSFDNYLRKDVNLNTIRYAYCPGTVNQGKIVQSPAGKVLKMNDFTTNSHQNHAK